jgi:NtrC-family two-component system sensor histidine kinase KinB
MPLPLKSKITLGVVFLFTLLLLVGGTGFFYLHKTTTEQRDILNDNYETIEYTRNMLRALDDSSGLPVFEQNLLKQEQNITEPGEATATATLRNHFNQLKQTPGTIQIRSRIREDISSIMQINLAAILEKNKKLGERSEEAKFFITILLTISALIGFTFVFNFPGYIANPISKFTAGIKAVAEKKYDQRIHLDRTDEFGEMADAFNRMAEELDRYEHSNLARILFEKQRAETVINSLKDASIGIDMKDRILFANPLALQLLNLTETDVVGQTAAQLAGRNDLFRFLQSASADRPFTIVVDNREQFFSREQVEIRNQDDLLGTMLVLKNITPYKELDVAKTNFMATISHELKTPLASSDFSLQLLANEKTGTLNEEQKSLIRQLRDDNRRLLKILGELLDLSQVETGKIRLQAVPVSVPELLQSVVQAVARAAQEKQIQIDITTEQDLPHILADSEKTGWVLINFLTNAIRYSPDRSTVIIHAEKEEGSVRISVRDQGPGIAPEYQSRIFDRFFRIPGTEAAGNGLGLSISRELITAMNGEMGLDTSPGQGASFWITLPVVI